MASQSIRKTQWIVAPSAELAERRAMVDGRVSTRRLFIFEADERAQALAAAAAYGESVFEFTYSFLPVEEPAPSTQPSAPR